MIALLWIAFWYQLGIPHGPDMPRLRPFHDTSAHFSTFGDAFGFTVESPHAGVEGFTEAFYLYMLKDDSLEVTVTRWELETEGQHARHEFRQASVSQPRQIPLRDSKFSGRQTP